MAQQPQDGLTFTDLQVSPNSNETSSKDWQSTPETVSTTPPLPHAKASA
jgi:hypothetical protein